MEGQVAKVCRPILGDPSLVPRRIAQAATRLMHFFGDRNFAGIDHRDFGRYLQAATCDPRADRWSLGGVSELACYDISARIPPPLGDATGVWDFVKTDDVG